MINPVRVSSLLCLLMMVGVIGLAVPKAWAQAFDIKKISELPNYPMDPAAFEAATTAYEDTPLGDKFLSYKIRLPKDWKKSADDNLRSQDLSKRLLGEVARYYGPVTGDVRSRFVIMALELDHEITARNWFLHYILSRGYTLQGMKELSDRRVEALYIQMEKDTPFVVRATAEINGPRMILSMVYVPEALWKGQEGMQDAIIDSFHFIAPEDSRLSSTQTFAFLDLLRFDYPTSWRLRAPNIQSIDVMEASVINTRDEKTLNGEIDINIISTELDTTLAEEVKALQKELEERGMVIGAMIEQPTDYTFQPQVSYNRVEVYEMTNKEKSIQDHEYWIAVLIEDRYYYIITMLTPSRNVDFYTWAGNTEAFGRVIQSMRP
ncbi:hypothetical protein [Micavibrio aeruginosavorus]|uniref:hypothetical protein n=1 Tax=Micavibrio aeruginosavorus TaxID=349221 RepID=UPI003F4ADE8B